MALPVIAPTDFTGWLKISGNLFKEAKFQEYIDLFNDEYVRRILGDSAYIDVVNTSKTKWDDLFNGVNYVNVDSKNRRNVGIKDQLIKFIYFEFLRDNFASSQTGKVSSSNENSTVLNGAEIGAIIMVRYNSAIRELCASVNEFLINYSSIETPITGFVDNADLTYTINLSSTLYLDDGDTVTIDNQDYVISGLIADTSFLITAASIGLTFDGDVLYEPYSEVDFNPGEFITL